MTRYLLVSRSIEYEARLGSLLGAQLAAVAGEHLTFGAEAVLQRIPKGRTPHIALLGPVLNYEETRQLVEGLFDRYPEIGVIVVREQRADLEDWVDGMRLHAVLAPDAGDATTLGLFDRLKSWLAQVHGTETADGDWGDQASALIETPASEMGIDAPDLEQAGPIPDVPEEPVDDAVVQPELEWLFPASLPEDVSTEVIAVVAPKGGQGKTTISINLAAGLASAAPNSVVLVDADVQFGDISAALDLSPAHTLVDAVNSAALGDELVLKTYLTRHADGFYVVPSAAAPEAGDEITSGQLGTLLGSLAKIFRYVVVDTTPGLSEHTLAVIENSTDAVFVTNMGVPSLRALRKELELLLQIGLLPDNKHVVLNFTDKHSGLTVRDAERVAGVQMNVVVPRSSAVLLASNRGVPLLYSDPRDGASVALWELATRIDRDASARRRRPIRKADSQ